MPLSTPATEPDPRPGLGETVLVVEDDPLVLRYVSFVLNCSGYSARTAPDGETALNLAVPSVDLLLTDVVLPGVSGPDLAATLSGSYPSVRVLFTSGYAPGTLAGRELPSGADFLPKPFTGSTLLRKVREVLDGPVTSRPPGAQ